MRVLLLLLLLLLFRQRALATALSS